MHSVDIEKGVCSDSRVQGFLHGTNRGMNGDGTYPAELAFVLLLQCSYQTYTLFLCCFSSQMNSGSCTYYLLPILFPVCCPVRFTWKNFWSSGKNVTRRLPFIRSLFIRVFWRLFFSWMISSFWNVFSFWIGAKSENSYEGILKK